MFDVRLLVLEDLLVLTTPLMICLGCLGCLLLRPAGAMYASSHRDFLLPAAAV
jgi:Fe-S-cluster-containing hydrogenase component 2